MAKQKMRGGLTPRKASNRYAPKKKDPLKGYNPNGMKLNLQEGAHLPEVVFASLLNNVLQGLLKIRNQKLAQNKNADLTNEDARIEYLKEQLETAKAALRPGELENYQEFKKLLKETAMVQEYLSLAETKKEEISTKKPKLVEDNILEDALSKEIDISKQTISENQIRLLEISKILGFNDIESAKNYLLTNAPAQERVQTLITKLDKVGIENLLTVRCEDSDALQTKQDAKNQLKGDLEDIGDSNKQAAIEEANTEEIAQTLEAIPTIASQIVVEGMQADSNTPNTNTPTSSTGQKLG